MEGGGRRWRVEGAREEGGQRAEVQVAQVRFLSTSSTLLHLHALKGSSLRTERNGEKRKYSVHVVRMNWMQMEVAREECWAEHVRILSASYGMWAAGCDRVGREARSNHVNVAFHRVPE